MKYAGREIEVRSIVTQVALIACVASIGWFLIATTLSNLQSRGVTTGFAFLFHPVSTPIVNSWLTFVPGVDTYARAVVIGFLNTLTVSFVVIVVSTVVGTLMGIARLSPNWLLSRSAAVFVDGVRNVPVLLQLVFWYQLILQLPPPRKAWMVAQGFFISNRGIRYPAIGDENALSVAFVTFVLLLIILIAVRALAKDRPQWMRGTNAVIAAVLALAVVPLAAVHYSGNSFALDVPKLQGLNFSGGAILTPELSALVLGLSAYTSAFVAEIVRAGIMGVPSGQREAANALGLRPIITLRKVIFPQALRIIIPPLTSEYVGVIKNSSLAIAVGYPDLFAIVNSMISDTGQAVEGVTIIILAFLTISLAIGGLMNWYDRSVALVTR